MREKYKTLEIKSFRTGNRLDVAKGREILVEGAREIFNMKVLPDGSLKVRNPNTIYKSISVSGTYRHLHNFDDILGWYYDGTDSYLVIIDKTKAVIYFVKEGSTPSLTYGIHTPFWGVRNATGFSFDRLYSDISSLDPKPEQFRIGVFYQDIYDYLTLPYPSLSYALPENDDKTLSFTATYVSRDGSTFIDSSGNIQDIIRNVSISPGTGETFHLVEPIDRLGDGTTYDYIVVLEDGTTSPYKIRVIDSSGTTLYEVADASIKGINVQGSNSGIAYVLKSDGTVAKLTWDSGTSTYIESTTFTIATGSGYDFSTMSYGNPFLIGRNETYFYFKGNSDNYLYYGSITWGGTNLTATQYQPDTVDIGDFKQYKKYPISGTDYEFISDLKRTYDTGSSVRIEHPSYNSSDSVRGVAWNGNYQIVKHRTPPKEFYGLGDRAFGFYSKPIITITDTASDNYFTDGGLENWTTASDLTDWTENLTSNAGTYTFSQDTAEKTEGSYSAKVLLSNTTPINLNATLTLSQSVNITVEDKYKFGFDIKWKKNRIQDVFGFSVRVLVYDSDNRLIANSPLFTKNNLTLNPQDFSTYEVVIRASRLIDPDHNIPAGTYTFKLVFDFTLDMGSGFHQPQLEVWLDNFKLQTVTQNFKYRARFILKKNDVKIWRGAFTDEKTGLDYQVKLPLLIDDCIAQSLTANDEKIKVEIVEYNEAEGEWYVVKEAEINSYTAGDILTPSGIENPPQISISGTLEPTTVYPFAKYCIIWKSSLVFGNTPENPNRIYFTDVYGRLKDTWYLDIGDSSPITGLAVLGDFLVIFKEKSIFTLSGSPPSWSSSWTPDWKFVQTIDGVGCKYPDTLSVVLNEAYFVSENGCYKFNGIQLTPLHSTIREVFEGAFDFSNSTGVAYVEAGERRYAVSCRNKGSVKDWIDFYPVFTGSLTQTSYAWNNNVDWDSFPERVYPTYSVVRKGNKFFVGFVFVDWIDTSTADVYYHLSFWNKNNNNYAQIWQKVVKFHSFTTLGENVTNSLPSILIDKDNELRLYYGYFHLNQIGCLVFDYNGNLKAHLTGLETSELNSMSVHSEDWWFADAKGLTVNGEEFDVVVKVGVQLKNYSSSYSGNNNPIILAVNKNGSSLLPMTTTKIANADFTFHILYCDGENLSLVYPANLETGITDLKLITYYEWNPISGEEHKSYLQVSESIDYIKTFCKTGCSVIILWISSVTTGEVKLDEFLYKEIEDSSSPVTPINSESFTLGGASSYIFSPVFYDGEFLCGFSGYNSTYSQLMGFFEYYISDFQGTNNIITSNNDTIFIFNSRGWEKHYSQMNVLYFDGDLKGGCSKSGYENFIISMSGKSGDIFGCYHFGRLKLILNFEKEWVKAYRRVFANTDNVFYLYSPKTGKLYKSYQLGRINLNEGGKENVFYLFFPLPQQEVSEIKFEFRLRRR